MSDPLIQEFEDAEKQEKMVTLWNEYGGYLIAAALLAVLFTGLITAYKNHQLTTDRNQTLALVAALESETPVVSLTDTAPELDGGLRAIADLSAAGYLLKDEKPAEALKVYEGAAADKSLPENFRDLAEFMAIRLKWDLAKNGGAAKDAEIATDHNTYINRLKVLMSKTNSPWQAHAHVQAALIMAENKNYDAALEYVSKALQIETVPPSLQQRARALQHVYALELAKQPHKDNTAEQEAQG